MDKKQTLLAFLQRGVAMVHLDARKPGVSVPAQFAGDPQLRLNLSYRYGIGDFDVGEEHVQATLSFGGRPFRCILPWPAIFAVTSQAGEGQVWPEDLPTDGAHGFEQLPARQAQGGDATAEEPSSEPPRPKLAAVGGERKRRTKSAEPHQESPASPVPSPSLEEKAPEPPDAPKRGGHLRLVR